MLLLAKRRTVVDTVVLHIVTRYWSVAVREDDRENSAGDRVPVGPLRTPSNRRKEPSIITRSQQEGYARSKK